MTTKDMLTVSLLIGNSDNKLSQEEYFNYINDIKDTLDEQYIIMHFAGGSNYDVFYQCACWVFEIPKENLDDLKKDVSVLRKYYRQESLVVIVGHTEFI